MMRSAGDWWLIAVLSTRMKNDLHLSRLTFRDRLIAGTEVHGPCALIQRPHLFIPLRKATLPDYLARIVSRYRTVGFADLYVRLCSMGVWSDVRIW